eukprot:TRINITY_DN1375_c0_g1_i1.p1 TRINITY_DN1375_c0_g1~~TRINITY_DN1375_c0_g1_i1.p1  ORF type:complete len:1358 (-),score=135.79 TRINITY_DN1375_c0_g1_i1:2422-6495(-)
MTHPGDSSGSRGRHSDQHSLDVTALRRGSTHSTNEPMPGSVSRGPNAPVFAQGHAPTLFSGAWPPFPAGSKAPSPRRLATSSANSPQGSPLGFSGDDMGVLEQMTTSRATPPDIMGSVAPLKGGAPAPIPPPRGHLRVRQNRNIHDGITRTTAAEGVWQGGRNGELNSPAGSRVLSRLSRESDAFVGEPSRPPSAQDHARRLSTLGGGVGLNGAMKPSLGNLSPHQSVASLGATPISPNHPPLTPTGLSPVPPSGGFPSVPLPPGVEESAIGPVLRAVPNLAALLFGTPAGPQSPSASSPTHTNSGGVATPMQRVGAPHSARPRDGASSGERLSFDGFRFVLEPWCCYFLRKSTCMYMPRHIGFNRAAQRQFDPHNPQPPTGVCMFGRTCPHHAPAVYELVVRQLELGHPPPPPVPGGIVPPPALCVRLLQAVVQRVDQQQRTGPFRVLSVGASSDASESGAPSRVHTFGVSGVTDAVSDGGGGSPRVSPWEPRAPGTGTCTPYKLPGDEASAGTDEGSTSAPFVSSVHLGASLPQPSAHAALSESASSQATRNQRLQHLLQGETHAGSNAPSAAPSAARGDGEVDVHQRGAQATATQASPGDVERLLAAVQSLAGKDPSSDNGAHESGAPPASSSSSAHHPLLAVLSQLADTGNTSTEIGSGEAAVSGAADHHGPARTSEPCGSLSGDGVSHVDASCRAETERMAPDAEKGPVPAPDMRGDATPSVPTTAGESQQTPAGASTSASDAGRNSGHNETTADPTPSGDAITSVVQQLASALAQQPAASSALMVAMLLAANGRTNQPSAASPIGNAAALSSLVGASGQDPSAGAIGNLLLQLQAGAGSRRPSGNTAQLPPSGPSRSYPASSVSSPFGQFAPRVHGTDSPSTRERPVFTSSASSASHGSSAGMRATQSPSSPSFPGAPAFVHHTGHHSPVQPPLATAAPRSGSPGRPEGMGALPAAGLQALIASLANNPAAFAVLNSGSVSAQRSAPSSALPPADTCGGSGPLGIVDAPVRTARITSGPPAADGALISGTPSAPASSVGDGRPRGGQVSATSGGSKSSTSSRRRERRRRLESALAAGPTPLALRGGAYRIARAQQQQQQHQGMTPTENLDQTDLMGASFGPSAASTPHSFVPAGGTPSSFATHGFKPMFPLNANTASSQGNERVGGANADSGPPSAPFMAHEPAGPSSDAPFTAASESFPGGRAGAMSAGGVDGQGMAPERHGAWAHAQGTQSPLQGSLLPSGADPTWWLGGSGAAGGRNGQPVRHEVSHITATGSAAVGAGDDSKHSPAGKDGDGSADVDDTAAFDPQEFFGLDALAALPAGEDLDPTWDAAEVAAALKAFAARDSADDP